MSLYVWITLRKWDQEKEMVFLKEKGVPRTPLKGKGKKKMEFEYLNRGEKCIISHGKGV